MLFRGTKKLVSTHTSQKQKNKNKNKNHQKNKNKHMIIKALPIHQVLSNHRCLAHPHIVIPNLAYKALEHNKS